MESSDEEPVFITCEVCDLPFTGIEPFEQHCKGKKHKKQMKIKKRQCHVKSLEAGGGTLELEETEDAEDQEFTCNICEMVFSGIIPYTQHLRSKPHAKVLQRKKAEEDPNMYDKAGSDPEISNDEANLNDMVNEIVPEPFGSCSICEKQFSGPETYHQHMKSKTHFKRKYELQLLKKIKVELNKSKDLDERIDCEDKEPHIAPRNFAADRKDEELECQKCNKVFSGPVPFAQHLTTKAHEKRQHQNKLLEELKTIEALEMEDQQSGEGQSGIFASIDPVLTCDFCCMSFYGAESAIAHLKSKGHKKIVKWKRYLSQRNQLVKQDKNNQKNGTEQDIANKNSELAASTDNASTDDDKAKEKDSPAGTASTDATACGGEASAQAFSDYAGECPPYQQIQEQRHSRELGHENTRAFGCAGENKKAKFLGPFLLDDDEPTEKKTNSKPLGTSLNSESDSSESENATSKDKKNVNRSKDAEVVCSK